MEWLLTAAVVLLPLILGKRETRSRGFEARLGIHGRLEKSDRASSATGYLLTEEMVGLSMRRGVKSGQHLRTGALGAEPRSRPRTSASSIAEACGRFVELPVPVVLVVSWLIGTVLLGTVLVAAYSAVVWLLAAMALL
jgi:hypothetical protein